MTGSITAQDGKKLLKMASKSIDKFIANPVEKMDLLPEAMTSLNQAFEDEKISSAAKNWVKKAEIFNKLADMQIRNILLNPGASFQNEDAAVMAFQSIQKALEISVKKGDTKNALYALEDAEGHLSNFAVELYKAGNHAKAFENFDGSIKAKEILTENGKKSRLDDPALMKDQMFFAGISSYYSKNYEAAKPYFMKMYEAGGADPLVYEGLFSMNKADNKAEALTYLEAGRTAHPDDTGLLFAEINHYLESGELDVLLEKLKVAQEKEPDNQSVTLTLGNVYDQLTTKAREAGDIEKADNYFGEAMKYYGLITAKDANNFDANYSLGALYYNKAAGMTNKINELSNDFSAAGTKKYDALKAEMDGFFNQAKPYFETAISQKPEDLNTLIALKEIAARSNDFTKADEYKLRIEAAQNK